MKHFTDIELGMKNVSSEIKENMYALVNNILDPLREKVGVIIVSSGYRSESYNKQIGGAKNSQHVKGEAVDIVFKNYDINKAFEYVKKNFTFDQLIFENRGGVKWLHISYSRVKNRKEVLIANKVNGKWIYKRG